MCLQGCVDEIPNFPLLDLAQGPHTFLYGPSVKEEVSPCCSSGMQYRNVEILVSILYYSPPAVEPRKPFVQEISRKKDRTVFQCPPYIFPYILSPQDPTSCMYCTVRDLLYTAVYSTCTWYRLRSTACMSSCTAPDLRSVPCLFCACLFVSD